MGSGPRTMIWRAALWVSLLTTALAAPHGNDFECFRKYPSQALTSSHVIRLPNTMLEECQEKCLHETDFLCLSFDYNSRKSTCYLSPDSTLSASHLLKEKDFFDHYERMLDCKHVHLPKAKEIDREPRPETAVKMVESAAPSISGNVVDLVLSAIERVSATTNVNDTGDDEMIVVLAVNEKSNGSMRLLHKEKVHTEDRRTKPVHSSRERHHQEAHEDDYKQNVLLRYIGHSRQKTTKHEHREEHLLHREREQANMMRDRHDREEEHMEMKKREKIRERHEDSHNEMPRVKRHSKPMSAKEKYIERSEAELKKKKRSATDQHHESHNASERGKRATKEHKQVHEEHKENVVRRSAKEQGKLEHDHVQKRSREPLHLRQKRSQGREVHEARERFERDADEELLRVAGQEAEHEKISDISENHIRAAVNGREKKDTQCATEKRKRSLDHKDRHEREENRSKRESLNEKQLKKAHEEELQRVQHEEKRSEKKRSTHLESAHQEDLMRVTEEEKRTRSSRLPFDDLNLERARREELARVKHDERYHAMKKEREAAGLGTIYDRGLGLERRNLDLAQQEELLRLRHEEEQMEEEERRKREEEMEEESGSGSGSEEIGSADEEDEGSGSGNWHWGPREVFEEEVDQATRIQQLVEDSDVWNTHAD